jgi:hypothetical protein
MLRLAVIGLFVVGTAACTAAPANLKSAAADPTAQAASPEEQKICRDMGTTGSYGPRHVCHTKAQWDKIDAMS